VRRDAASTQGGRRRARDRGSVFIESVVAAAIVAMALVGTLRVIADSAARDHAVEDRRAAVLIAQSELDAVGSEIPLAEGQSAGVAGDLVWRVATAPYTEAGDPGPAGIPWRVVVTVSPRAGGRVLARLESLRLGPAPRL
jgi:general secretion pathway protein I